MNRENYPPAPEIPNENKLTRRKFKQITGYDLINENVFLPGSRARDIINATMRGNGKYVRTDICACREPRGDDQRCPKYCANFLVDFECTNAVCAERINLCWNRALTERRYKRMQVIARPDICGMGLKTLEAIQNWDVIVEYCGRVSTEQENPHAQDKTLSSYACSLIDAPFQDMAVVVDATECGNIARYINHSHKPNCKVGKMRVGDELRVVIRAKRDIRAGEELLWDYGKKYKLVGIKMCGCQAGVKKCPDHEEFKNSMAQIRMEAGAPPTRSLLPVSPATSCSSNDADHPQPTEVRTQQTKPKKTNPKLKAKTSTASSLQGRVTRGAARRCGNEETSENVPVPRNVTPCTGPASPIPPILTPPIVLRSPVMRSTPCIGPRSPLSPAITSCSNPRTPLGGPILCAGRGTPFPPVLTPNNILRTPARGANPCVGSRSPLPPVLTPNNILQTPGRGANPCAGRGTPFPPVLTPNNILRTPARGANPCVGSRSPLPPVLTPNFNQWTSVGRANPCTRPQSPFAPNITSYFSPQSQVGAGSSSCVPPAVASCSTANPPQAAGRQPRKNIVVPRASTRKIQSSDEELFPETDRMVTRSMSKRLKGAKENVEQAGINPAATGRPKTVPKKGKKKIIRPNTEPVLDLQVHTPQDSGPPKYACGDCNQAFQNRYELIRHMRASHWTPGAPPLASLLQPQENRPGCSRNFNFADLASETCPPKETPLHEESSMDTLSSVESDMSL